MKKIIVLGFTAALLSGCADKQQYEAAVLEQVKEDKDLADYKVDNDSMVECVVDLSSKKMPGSFPFDPARLMAYRNYAKMLNLTKSEDPMKTLQELRTDFGSPLALAEARSNFSNSIMECMASILSGGEKAIQEKEQAEQEKGPEKIQAPETVQSVAPITEDSSAASAEPTKKTEEAVK